MRAAAPRTQRLQWISARRATWLFDEGVVEGVARVTSLNNVWADWGSRGRLGEVAAAAAAMRLCGRRVGVSAEWRDTSALLTGIDEGAACDVRCDADGVA
eukprot:2076903-Prymnesium_polylepis.2